MAIHVWNGRLLVFWLRIVKHTVTAATASQYSQALVTKKVTTPPPNFASMNVDDARSQTTQGAPSQVAVQAILCWSEYYNGKWQPVKTSDVNNPTTIGDFDAVGPGQFDRTKYQLKVASYSGYQLVVSIKLSGQKFDSEPPGFLLYNTHSVPPALEDASEDLNWGSMNWRVFGTSYSGSGGTVDPNVAYPPSASPNQFIISYNKMVAIPTPHIVNDSVNQVLQSPMGERVLAPQVVTSAASAWNLPFFFEDSRNVFYVTTSQATIHFGKYLGYAGVLGLTAAASRSIANLVVPEVPDPIPFFAPVISGANADSASPDQMRRFVSEDAYIRTGIATTNTVSYQGTQIGPRGGLPVTKS